MKPFREINLKDLNSLRLQEELESYGYVLIRQLLPTEDIDILLHEIVRILAAHNWFLPNHDPVERVANPIAACGDPDPVFKPIYDEIFNLEALHRFSHQLRLRDVMHLIVGSRLLVHPKPMVRLIFPHDERFVVHAHQDHRAIGGDPEFFTAWMPLHDCPAELGPLHILEGSHRFGFQEADDATGVISRDTALGGSWVSGQIRAGDVLIFHGLTVHSASLNTSAQLRVSVDCRFQDYTRAFNPVNAVFPGANGKSWETTYTGWHSEELRYFWRQFPLKLEPSKDDLAELVKTEASEKLRARYARILSQLENYASVNYKSHNH